MTNRPTNPSDRAAKAVPDALRACLAAWGEADVLPDPRELAEAWRTAGGSLPAPLLESVAREMVSAARARREPTRIAFFGPEGTFTHMAAHARFGSAATYVALRAIEDVFSEVEKKHAHCGVVPIENSYEGAVTHTLDEFVDSPLKITAEIVLPIAHHLLANCEPAEVRKVYSIPQALGQCRRWLRSRLPDVEIVETSSTARAAQIAREEPGAAAVASRFAADLYGLSVAAAEIQDSSQNATRFLVIGGEPPPPSGHDRTSFLFVVRDRVGALYEGLNPFRTYGINLTKIESRPSRRRPWEYVFFVDFAGHAEEEGARQALAELREHCEMAKVLGSYRRSDPGEGAP